MKMKKTLITLAVFAAVAASPAHAISAGYRAQLERSGCTQETDGNGCDIHKTAAQNGISRHEINERHRAADAQRSEAHADGVRSMKPFLGKWKVYQPNGQHTADLVVKSDSVTMNGSTAQGYNVTDGKLNIYMNAMTVVLGKGKGTWENSSTGDNGYLTR